MEFLKITSVDGTQRYVNENNIIRILTAADTLDAGSLYSAPKVIRGLITGVAFNGATTAVSAPVLNTVTTALTGGLLLANTYFYVVSATNALGVTGRSNELSVTTTGVTSSNTISWTKSQDATGYRVYRGTAAGAENVYYVTGDVATYTDTGAAAVTGTPPSNNTTSAATVISNDPIPAYNGANLRYEYGCKTIDGAFSVAMSN